MNKQQIVDKFYKNYIKASLEDTYFMLCTKKCIKTYETQLNESEKICLAKCLDRANDYLILGKKYLNPNQKEYKYENGKIL